jgi:hypothetical protein
MKTMSISETAMEFFEACETRKGGDFCAQWCHEDASFSCQSDALADLTSLSDYADYVYVMNFEDGKIRHMTKIWNDGFALKMLGWA